MLPATNHGTGCGASRKTTARPRRHSSGKAACIKPRQEPWHQPQRLSDGAATATQQREGCTASRWQEPRHQSHSDAATATQQRECCPATNHGTGCGASRKATARPRRHSSGKAACVKPRQEPRHQPQSDGAATATQQREDCPASSHGKSRGEPSVRDFLFPLLAAMTLGMRPPQPLVRKSLYSQCGCYAPAEAHERSVLNLRVHNGIGQQHSRRHCCATVTEVVRTDRAQPTARKGQASSISQGA